jgi:16S rRNA processing protein RimM
MKDYLLIATVLRPHGIHGENKLRSYAADPSSFLGWNTLFLKSGDAFLPVSVRTVRIQENFIYAVLDQCASVNEAEAFRGKDLYIDRVRVLPSDREAVLIEDLIGCEAVDENGLSVGILTDVLQYGPVDTWVFRSGEGTLMVPALRAVFPVVDAENRRISVCRERLEEVAVLS